MNEDWNIPLGKIRDQAQAYRDMEPYINQLQEIGQKRGWTAGSRVLACAIEELERLPVPSST